MICSMTAFGSARVQNQSGSVTVELRGVNNRFLDLNLRVPDDLAFVESGLREQVSKRITRGKIDLRIHYAADHTAPQDALDFTALKALADTLQTARTMIADIPAPPLSELPRISSRREGLSPDIWRPLCEQACAQALDEFCAARTREGTRLAYVMKTDASEIEEIVQQVQDALPALVERQQQRVAQKLHEALAAAHPSGFAAITGEELSARIAQESAVFGLRVDVAEEIARLRAHVDELHDILAGTHEAQRTKGHGKRLDFLFQEMNREANTLGSKAAGLTVTEAAINLKLLIEQLREQAQNIE